MLDRFGGLLSGMGTTSNYDPFAIYRQQVYMPMPTTVVNTTPDGAAQQCKKAPDPHNKQKLLLLEDV